MVALDTEREIIATLANADAVGYYFNEGLDEEQFADPRCRLLYEWAINYWLNYGNMKVPPSHEVLLAEFPDYDDLIAETSGAAPSYLCKRLKGEYAKRQCRDVLTTLLPVVEQDPISAMTMFRDAFSGISDMCKSASYSIEYGKDMEAYRKRVEEQRMLKGVPYPFQEMTDDTGGIKPGELCILCAPPATGKTVVACKAALEAMRAGHNVYFASLELTIENIAQRIEYMVANENGVRVNIADYGKGITLPQYEEAILEAQDYIASLPGKLFIEQPRVEDRTPTALVASCKSKGCDYIIVDQLQFVTKPRRDTLQESYGAALQEFKQQIMTPSDGVRIPLLLLHQMNREGAKNQSKGTGRVGNMTDIAGSAWVEQIADIVWGLGRNEEERNNNIMNIATLKVRNVSPVGFRLYWDSSYGYQFHVLRDEYGMPIRLKEWA